MKEMPANYLHWKRPAVWAAGEVNPFEVVPGNR